MKNTILEKIEKLQKEINFVEEKLKFNVENLKINDLFDKNPKAANSNYLQNNLPKSVPFIYSLIRMFADKGGVLKKAFKAYKHLST